MVMLMSERQVEQSQEQHDLDMEAARARPSFIDTQEFVLDVLRNTAFETLYRSNPFVEQTFDWDFSQSVMETMSKLNGKFRDHECQSLKDGLVKLDSSNTG